MRSMARKAKRQVVEACLDLDCTFIAQVIHHDIIRDQDADQHVCWAADYVIGRLNAFLRNKAAYGMVVMDNLPGHAEFGKGEVSLPRDDRLIAELSAIRYNYAPSGAILLEPKEHTKKRVGHSPDLADACVLGFAKAIGTYIGDLDLSVNDDLVEPSRWRIEGTSWTSGKIY